MSVILPHFVWNLKMICVVKWTLYTCGYQRDLSATYLHVFHLLHTLSLHRSTSNQHVGCRCRHNVHSIPCRNPCLLLGQLVEHPGISYKAWSQIQSEFFQNSQCLVLELIPLQWNLSNDELQINDSNSPYHTHLSVERTQCGKWCTTNPCSFE